MDRLAGPGQWVRESELELHLLFLDSPEWRLHRAGLELRGEIEGGRRRLTLATLEGMEPPLLQPVTKGFPRAVESFREGPLRGRIEPILGEAPLMPHLELEVARDTFALLDDESKTVLRLHYDRYRLPPLPGSEVGELAPRLWLMPVRGFDRVCSEVGRWLETEGGLIEAGRSLLDEALQRLARRPAGYSAVPSFGFGAHTRTDQALREILLHWVAVFEANIPGVRADLDPGFIAEMADGGLQLNQALTELTSVFADHEERRWQEQFAWLDGITRPLRHCIRLMGCVDRSRGELPVPFREAAEPLRSGLVERCAQRRAELVAQLETPRLQRVLEEARGWLEAPLPALSHTAHAIRPIRETAERRILRLHKRLLKRGQGLDGHLGNDELQGLRGTCGRLASLLGWFRGLYPEPEITPWLERFEGLKAELDRLPLLHDCAEQLLNDLHALQRQGSPSAESLVAAGMLLEKIENERRTLIESLLGELDSVTAPAQQRAFLVLFGGKG